jgi:hypothetical protein
MQTWEIKNVALKALIGGIREIRSTPMSRGRCRDVESENVVRYMDSSNQDRWYLELLNFQTKTSVTSVQMKAEFPDDAEAPSEIQRMSGKMKTFRIVHLSKCRIKQRRISGNAERFDISDTSELSLESQDSPMTQLNQVNPFG